MQLFMTFVVLGLFYKCPGAAALSFLQFSGGSTLSAEQEAGFDWPRYSYSFPCCRYLLALSNCVFNNQPTSIIYVIFS